MDFRLVRIRLQQISRESGGLGVFYTLLIAGVFVLIEWGLWKQYQNIYNAWAIFGGLLGLLTVLHITRKDSAFVWKQIDQPQKVFYGEYFILSLPITLPVLLSWQFYCFPVFMLLLAAIVQLRKRIRVQRFYLSKLSKLIPVYYFEWLSGIRRNSLFFIILYLLAWGFCWVPALPLVVIWLLMMGMMPFFAEGEALNILRIGALSPRVFLHQKLKRHLILQAIFIIPLLMANAIFNPHLWMVYPIFYFFQAVGLCFMILSKYSQYEPQQNLTGSSVIQSFAMAGTIIPFLAPLPFVLCFRYYARAMHNLAQYL